MSILRSVFLILAILLFAMPLSAYSQADWSSNPQIAWENNAQGDTVLTIIFDFSEMSDPPSSFHYPKRFQIQTSLNGVDWTELDPVSISPRPTTTLFDVTYDIGKVSETLQIQARLECSIHGWSVWPKVFTITPSGDLGGGEVQVEKTITTTVTTTTTHTTTTTSTTTQQITTTVTQVTTSLLTTIQREALAETATSTFTEEVPIIESSALALLGVGIAVAGIAIALGLTRRK